MTAGSRIAVHQYNDSIAGRDGIGHSMLFIRELLRGFGFRSEIYVDYIGPNLDEGIKWLSDLDPAPDDILLIHHSLFSWHLDRLAALNCRKVMVYHSITPPKYFEPTDPLVDLIRNGFAQIERYRDRFAASIAISPYNARQLRQRGVENVTVLPLLRDFGVERFRPHRKLPYYDGEPVVRLLYVGRIVPHKCQLELVEAVAAIRHVRGIPLELTLVGHAEHGRDYCGQIDGQIATLGLAGRVVMTGSVSDEELYGYFRAADAYVSFSEHEGFGIPLIEAMALDVPVIAYAAAGIPDTLGDAGIMIEDKSAAALLTPLLRLHDDRNYRGELVRRQRGRVLDFSRTRIERDFRRWLAGMGAVAGSAASAGAPEPPVPAALGGTAPQGPIRYVIEGPFETAYSLASVNRELAVALHRREGRVAHIEPAEGVESYQVDTAAAQALLRAVTELVGPPPLSADRIVTVRQMYPPRPNGMLGDLRLVLLPWEETAIPGDWAGMINAHADGVVVPSEFCRRAMRNSGVRRPIGVIGNGIDHLPGSAAAAPRGEPAREPEAPFTFLHISTGLARKGIEELLTAYCAAFSSADPVLLVLKTTRNEQNLILGLAEWVGPGPAAPAIEIVAEELDPAAMERLYARADAVVLPSRGEGFCLPAAEAMARGIPVIVTGFGGQLDFCTAANSVLLDYEFETSGSHLGVPNSLWVRPSVPQLAAAMRAVCRDRGDPGSPSARRAHQARHDVAALSWARVAQQFDDFVDDLSRRPVMTRPLRLAWVSTYNARCGIATYSHSLLRHLPHDAFAVTVIANQEPPVAADPPGMVRLWTNRGGKLDEVKAHVLAGEFDAVCIQFHFGFFDLDELSGLLTACDAAGIDTYMTLHRTRDHELFGVSLRQIAAALRRCTRLFVHGVEDVNRLKELGVVDNVVLVPHGVLEPPQADVNTARTLLNLQRFAPVIGCFGFIAPPKGFPILLHAFALIRRQYPNALLLMLTAENGSDELKQERQRCQALIHSLGLQDNVLLVSEFIEDEEELLFLLGACDTVVFPYQYSMEAASGAIRIGLASGRPVGCTPLPIFDDFTDLVFRFAGTGAFDIAKGIAAMLDDDYPREAIAARQRQWLRDNGFAAQARRLGNIIAGCREDRLGTEIRPLPQSLAEKEPGASTAMSASRHSSKRGSPGSAVPAAGNSDRPVRAPSD